MSSIRHTFKRSAAAASGIGFRRRRWKTQDWNWTDHVLRGPLSNPFVVTASADFSNFEYVDSDVCCIGVGPLFSLPERDHLVSWSRVVGVRPNQG